jgi:hypothetical protein
MLLPINRNLILQTASDSQTNQVIGFFAVKKLQKAEFYDETGEIR